MNERPRTPSPRLAPGLVAALAALSGLPLALAPYAPMQDLAAHVETSCQLLNIWQGDERFTSVLHVQSQPWANSLPTILIAALFAIWPGYGVAKFVVALCAIAWPVSLALCFRAFGRSPWLGLIALPTVFDLSWSYGFLQFIAAKPLLPLVLMLALAHSRGGWKHGVALTGLLVVTFVTHSLVWLLATAGAGVVVVICARTWRARLIRLWPLIPAALATLPFFLATRGQQGQTRYHQLSDALSNLWANLGDLHSGATDGVAWIVAALCVLGCFLRRRGPRPAREHVALLVVGVVVLCAYLFGPTVLPQVSVVAPRIAGTALGLLVGALPTPHPRVLLGVIAAMAIAFVFHIVDVTRSYRDFSRAEMGEFAKLLDHIPEGTRVATHYTFTSSKYARHNALWHWPKLHCLSGDGYTDDLFAYRKTAYVAVKDKSFVTMPHRMRPDALAPFSALLVRGKARAPAPFQPVDTAGTWQLYLREQ